MLHFHSLLAVAFTLSTSVMQAQAKAVFAHFIVGNAASHTIDDWADDIQQAKDASIDGFALNIGGDSYTGTQLTNAYSAAKTAGGFSLFISFDFAAYPSFDVDTVSNLINTYKDEPAQYKYNNMPLVSTFEGPDVAAEWPSIRSAVPGGIFFIPDWTSIKGSAPGNFSEYTDGALSWDVWPTGTDPIDISVDLSWKSILGSKAYMMGVSPWFYTNLPSKNYVQRGDDLWHDRWQQVIEVQPDFVEILTWNDFGESHYIGPLRPDGFPTGSERYVANNPHDAWRELLPYYIAAYKSGNSSLPVVDQVKLVYAHRPNPYSAGSADGTAGNPPYQTDPTYAPQQVSQDVISLSVLVKAAADVTVQIGDNSPTQLRAMNAGVNHFSVPFNGQTGNVTYTVSRDGRQMINAVGGTITDECNSGDVNWNAVVGSLLS